MSQRDLGEIRVRVNTALQKLPHHIQKAIRLGKTQEHCATFSEALMEELEKIAPGKAKKAQAEHPDNEGHTYIVVPGNTPEEDIIIDSTASQFLKGLQGVYIGTRASLRSVLTMFTLTSTRYKNKPDEAFKRTWGDQSERREE